MRKNIPGLERIINLTDEMKIIGSETLGIIENAEKTHNKLWDDNRLSARDSDFAAFEFVKVTNKKVDMAYELPIDEDSLDFQDAQSHVSEKIEDIDIDIIRTTEIIPHRTCLPVLRNPRQKMNV